MYQPALSLSLFLSLHHTPLSLRFFFSAALHTYSYKSLPTTHTAVLKAVLSSAVSLLPPTHPPYDSHPPLKTNRPCPIPTKRNPPQTLPQLSPAPSLQFSPRHAYRSPSGKSVASFPSSSQASRKVLRFVILANIDLISALCCACSITSRTSAWPSTLLSWHLTATMNDRATNP